MQHCQYCGSDFPDDARFCGQCGRTPALDSALARTSTPPVSLPFVPPPQADQPEAEDEEERRRAAILPLPIPPLPNGSQVGGQVPQVAGTLSFSGVPTIQGTSPSVGGPLSPSTPPPAGSALASSAPSVPPGASPAGQPGASQQQVFARTDAPGAQHSGSTGLQDQRPPAQDHQGRRHHRHHGEPRTPHGRRASSKVAAGGGTKLILIAIAALIVVAGGASALVFALHARVPGPSVTTPVITGKGTPTSCAKSGVACTGTGTVTAAPSGPNGAPSDDASFVIKQDPTSPAFAAGNFFSWTLLRVTGHPGSPTGSTVCAQYGDGKVHTVPDPTNPPDLNPTITLTITCQSGTYQGGKLAYTEAVRTLGNAFHQGGISETCVDHNPPPEIWQFTGVFSSPTHISGTWTHTAVTDSATCNGSAVTGTRAAGAGAWSGTLVSTP